MNLSNDVVVEIYSTNHIFMIKEANLIDAEIRGSLKACLGREDFYVLILLRSRKVTCSPSRWDFLLKESKHFQ